MGKVTDHGHEETTIPTDTSFSATTVAVNDAHVFQWNDVEYVAKGSRFHHSRNSKGWYHGSVCITVQAPAHFAVHIVRRSFF